MNTSNKTTSNGPMKTLAEFLIDLATAPEAFKDAKFEMPIVAYKRKIEARLPSCVLSNVRWNSTDDTDVKNIALYQSTRPTSDPSDSASSPSMGTMRDVINVLQELSPTYDKCIVTYKGFNIQQEPFVMRPTIATVGQAVKWDDTAGDVQKAKDFLDTLKKMFENTIDLEFARNTIQALITKNGLSDILKAIYLHVSKDKLVVNTNSMDASYQFFRDLPKETYAVVNDPKFGGFGTVSHLYRNSEQCPNVYVFDQAQVQDLIERVSNAQKELRTILSPVLPK